jgi:HTH-type transcriptional regulator / antitoxin HigA
MTTMVSVPVIRTNADLAVALARIDTLIDAPEGTPEADERATLGTLVSVYEEEHHPYPTLTGPALLYRCMEAQGLNQSQVPEIGPQPLVSAVLNGKRMLTPRMAIELGRRFRVPAEAFLGLSPTTAATRDDSGLLIEDIDALCCRLTGFRSLDSFFTDVLPSFAPSFYPRDDDWKRLADAYDAEAENRGDPRRAIRGP